MIAFFDTETTGLLKFKEHNDHPDQPYLVELYIVLDDENRKTVATYHTQVRPEEWEIPQEASNIHGISTDMAKQYGSNAKYVIKHACGLFAMAKTIVGHNSSFDKRVMQIMGHKIKGRPAVDKVFAERDVACTMRSTTDLCKIASPRGFKWPKLAEAASILLGVELKDAHTAAADTLMCRDVYYWLIDNKKKVVTL